MSNEAYEIGNGQTCQMRLGDVCGSLDCMHDQKAILMIANEHQKYKEGTTTGTLTAGQNSHIRGDTPLICGGGENMNRKTVVRRLTPLECERLQGFPDGWTDIGTWTDTQGKKHKPSDAPRYKALGNSLAVGYANNRKGFWCWLADRMVEQLKADGVEDPTMASLFDGIGGFPLAYQSAGCKPIWASEIEEFPIAVTKIHFPEEEERKN